MKRFKKILVVDDSDLLRELAIDLLKKTQAAEEVQQARHGKEALEILIKETASGAHVADLIILDLQMPVMDGLEFLEALHESNQLNCLLNRVVVVTSVLTPKIGCNYLFGPKVK